MRHCDGNAFRAATAIAMQLHRQLQRTIHDQQRQIPSLHLQTLHARAMSQQLCAPSKCCAGSAPARGSRPACFGSGRPSVCRSAHSGLVANAAGQQQQHEASPPLARRELLALSLAAPLLLQQGAAQAEGDYSTFFGLATPPTSYGGYGGNANETPKYTFEYPTGWKSEVPSKVEKGTQGIDGRVVNPRSKDQRAFVITLGRAGEDNKSFRLTDLDSTFQSFAGADYDLQDALSDATATSRSEAERDGINFYQYEIESPAYRYLSSIAVKDGKVFALFVRSPSRMFAAAEGDLRHIVDTFRLL